MLIRYKDHVINLDQVTDFFSNKSVDIRFYHPFWNNELEFQAYTSLEFDSKEKADSALERILYCYSNGFTTCQLG